MLATGLVNGDPVMTWCVPAGSVDTDNGLPKGKIYKNI